MERAKLTAVTAESSETGFAGKGTREPSGVVGMSYISTGQGYMGVSICQNSFKNGCMSVLL